MTTLNSTTSPQQKQQAFRIAVGSHGQLRKSFNHPSAKWRKYFDACAATGWTQAPDEMRPDIQAWQNSSPVRNSAVRPMRDLELTLY